MRKNLRKCDKSGHFEIAQRRKRTCRNVWLADLRQNSTWSVSVDSVHTHRAWINTPADANGLGRLNFPLASDITKSVARDYGVLVEEEGVALRGLFIIDPEGEVKYEVVSHNKVGRSVDETIRVLQALQSGGLCPSDWKPGDKHLAAN